MILYLKKNLNASRPSEHPPVRGEKMSKRLGGIIGCEEDKVSSWHLNPLWDYWYYYNFPLDSDSPPVWDAQKAYRCIDAFRFFFEYFF